MSQQGVDYVTCDGCKQLIDWGNTLYRVWFTTSDGVDVHFHNHGCVRTWVDAQEVIRNENLALEAAHKQLHDKLDAEPTVDKDAWQAENGIVESHDLAETNTFIEQIGVPSNG